MAKIKGKQGKNFFDLSHYTFRTGKMGRLMPLTTIPVVAGDSMRISLEGIFRLASLRRYMTTDAQIDTFAFYVPHRHIYGDTWTNFIKEGYDEAQTFPAVTVAADAPQHFYPFISGQLTYPQWLVAGYNRIWNRYFRRPTDTAGTLTDTATFPNSPIDNRNYGRLIGRLKTPWSTMNTGDNLAQEDREIDLKGTNPDEYIDLLDIEKVKQQYKTELERDWFNVRYSDIIDNVWGGKVNIDADERPQLIMRKTTSLSGYDIDGSSGSEFGTFIGKSMGNATFNMPRRFFPEHGTLWLMSSIRFPTMHLEEVHPLTQNVNPTYHEWAADPEIVRSQPPIDLFPNQWLLGSTTSAVGKIPYGQYYRCMPNVMARDQRALLGFPFLKNNYTTADELSHHQETDYDDVFQTQQLGHWQLQGKVNCEVSRYFPTARQSIFAGTR